MTLLQFNQDLRTRIPSIELLGMEFSDISPNRVCLKIPFKPNKNHMDTAFGGSIYLGAVTACYGLFRAMTLDRTASNEYIILKRGSIDYLKPITTDFEAVAERETNMPVEQMLESVAKVGHGKLEIKSRVLCGGQKCASLTGLFVLRKK